MQTITLMLFTDYMNLIKGKTIKHFIMQTKQEVSGTKRHFGRKRIRQVFTEVLIYLSGLTMYLIYSWGIRY